MFQPALARLRIFLALMYAAPAGALAAIETDVMVALGPHHEVAFRSGRRSILTFTVDNRGAPAQRIQATTRATATNAYAIGRELTVPGHSRRVSWHPLAVPAPPSGGNPSVDVQTMYKSWPVESQSVRTDAQSTTVSSSLPLEGERVVTAVLSDHADKPVQLLIRAARQTQNLSERLIQLRSDRLPGTAEFYEAYDQIVLATDALMDDAAAQAAIRQWVASGGRLWVLLDRVPPRSLQSMLGDGFKLTVIDRTSLSRVSIRDMRDVPRRADGAERRYDDPVALVRVILDSSVHPSFGVSDWPAAFWHDVGQGRILCTTLAPEAWIADSPSNANVSATGPLHVLASEFFTPRAPRPQMPLAMDNFAAELIGFSIVGRKTVALILGACVVTAIVATIRPFGRQRRMHASWTIAAVCALASAGLITIGGASQGSVEPTMASVQLVEVDAERGDVHVDAVLGAYFPRAGAMNILGEESVLSPDMPLLSRFQGRLLWTDLSKWRVDAPLPSGLTLQRCRWHRQMNESPIKYARLTADGVEGALDRRQFASVENAILAAPVVPMLAVRVNEQGVFRATSADQLEYDQFAATTFVNEAARRRQQVLRELISSKQGFYSALDGPTLIFWTSAGTPPLTMGNVTRQVGESLVIIPLAIDDAPDGSIIAIPPTLLPFEAVDGKDGMPVSSAYSNSDRQWIDGLTAATRITLRFQMPRAAQASSIKHATFYAEITAPGRTVNLSAWRDEVPVELLSARSPVGSRLEATIRDPQLLRLDDQGGLLLNLEVKRHRNEEDASLAKIGWKVNRVWLDVHAAAVHN